MRLIAIGILSLALLLPGCGQQADTTPATSPRLRSGVSCRDSDNSVHASGTTWRCADGCNTCSCGTNGEISSTLKACL